MGDKMVLIQTLVPPELKREIMKLARQQNRPLSNFVRQILIDLIEQEEQRSKKSDQVTG